VLGSDGPTSVVDGPVDPHRLLVTQGNYQLSDGMAVRQSSPAQQSAPERQSAAVPRNGAGS
jgi:hypothetical protein